MPIYAVRHRTIYAYTKPVELSVNLARLRPRELAGQRLTHFALESDPPVDDVREESDFFGNSMACFKVAGAHERFEITTHSRVDVSWSGREEPPASPPWEEVAQTLREAVLPESQEALQFTFDSPMVKPFPELAGIRGGGFSRRTSGGRRRLPVDATHPP